MSTTTRPQSLDDMHITSYLSPEEFNDSEYFREVLQLADGSTEDAVDAALAQRACALGITITPSANLRNGDRCESAATEASERARTGSSGSHVSASTCMTSPRSSNEMMSNGEDGRRDGMRRSVSFSEYDRFLGQVNIPTAVAAPVSSNPAPSLFSVSTKRSMITIRNGIMSRFALRKAKVLRQTDNSCVCCRDDFKKTKTLRTLPCLHKYCDKCLRVLVQQALSEESKMPPKCCGLALHTSILKALLSHDEQHAFVKSIQQYSTPWEERIFCPNSACGEFISKPRKVNPKRPFQLVCHGCGAKVCSICKRNAHMAGQDCPLDWELDAVLRMGKDKGWKRCYKCRSLVELTQGCSHITCRCKAEFCYICGAVWDPAIGCPNYCTGEEELERRRIEDEARAASEAAERAEREAVEKALARSMLEAQKRTDESEELRELRKRQIWERDKFCTFEEQMKWRMWGRLGQMRVDLFDRYAEAEKEMKERHERSIAHLEDRQVTAEMELRAGQKQAARIVHGRLRHMEAYCHGLGLRSGVDSETSSLASERLRVVTERDLRELGLQYNVRDDMERLHQSRINVMRERQTKAMERLLAVQEEEAEGLEQKKVGELERLVETYSAEEGKFKDLFARRRERLERRWRLDCEVTRKTLEAGEGAPFAPLLDVEWPEPSRRPEALSVVLE